MSNLFNASESRDFYVYVDPKDWWIQHQVHLIGSFTSVPPDTKSQTLMFLPNPEFKTFISAFQSNLVRNYTAEYNLEIARRRTHHTYPSRLQSIFLLDSEEEAKKYANRYRDHVGNRMLKKVRTNGAYLYSLHDSSWVDFLRLRLSFEEETLAYVARCYWTGECVADHELIAMGKSWSEEAIFEVLYLGQVDFYDRSLDI